MLETSTTLTVLLMVIKSEDPFF